MQIDFVQFLSQMALLTAWVFLAAFIYATAEKAIRKRNPDDNAQP
jgi:hypothetical protein